MPNKGKAILAAIGKHMMLNAQDGRCYLCCEIIVGAHHYGPGCVTVDHVHPKCNKEPGVGTHGCVLLAHHDCNQAKGHREPSGCELLFLYATNRRLGYSERDTQRWDRVA